MFQATTALDVASCNDDAQHLPAPPHADRVVVAVAYRGWELRLAKSAGGMVSLKNERRRWVEWQEEEEEEDFATCRRTEAANLRVNQSWVVAATERRGRCDCEIPLGRWRKGTKSTRKAVGRRGGDADRGARAAAVARTGSAPARDRSGEHRGKQRMQLEVVVVMVGVAGLTANCSAARAGGEPVWTRTASRNRPEAAASRARPLSSM